MTVYMRLNVCIVMIIISHGNVHASIGLHAAGIVKIEKKTENSHSCAFISLGQHQTVNLGNY